MSVASAPGKLMIAGEYVIVRPGSAALAVAVSARMRVHLDLGGKGWRVTSDLMGLVEADVEHVPLLANLVVGLSNLAKGGHFTIESELGVGPHKPGLGSSAALCVAASGALSHALGQPMPAVDELVETHRKAQGGSGSGYDVVLAHQGGTVALDSRHQPMGLDEVSWPDGLHAVILSTGQGASTAAMLRRFNAWCDASPGAAQVHQAQLAAASEALVAAWRTGEVRDVLDALTGCQESLQEMDLSGRLGIMEGGQMELLTLIEEAGALGRTSGAGGGDCVWAFSDDSSAIDAVIASAAGAGFTHLDLEFPSHGLRIE
jgi:phosphomevalonate kinase